MGVLKIEIMKKLLYVLVIVSLSSCTTLKKCNNKFPPQIKEITIRTDTVIYRDTTIYVTIKGETVYKTDTVFIDRGGLIQSGVSFLNTKYATSKAYVKDSRLFHTLNQIKDSIPATIIGGKFESVTLSKEQVKTVMVERKLSIIQQVQIWAGRLFFISLLIFIGMFIFRKA